MKYWTLVVCVALTGCAAVRQPDLDSWKGMPVEALDTHSLFVSMPMYKTVSGNGIEIRNYTNGRDVASCFSSLNGTGGVFNASGFSTCSSTRVACNNLFYIKDGKVLEYVTSGRCRTDDSVRPQQRYLNLSR